MFGCFKWSTATEPTIKSLHHLVLAIKLLPDVLRQKVRAVWQVFCSFLPSLPPPRAPHDAVTYFVPYPCKSNVDLSMGALWQIKKIVQTNYACNLCISWQAASAPIEPSHVSKSCYCRPRHNGRPPPLLASYTDAQSVRYSPDRYSILSIAGSHFVGTATFLVLYPLCVRRARVCVWRARTHALLVLFAR